MRYLLILSIAMLGLGALTLALVVLSAGVPYHDGPNSGYVNPPGLMRSIENASLVLFCLGVGTVFLGVFGMLVFLLNRAKQRKSGV